MSARIEQMNVSYSRDEDRLLLRIRSTDNEEFRLWLTRRYTQLAFRALEKLLQDVAPGTSVAAPQRAAEVAFDHQHTTSQADFATPYEETADSYPLGEDGILGYRITVEQKNGAYLHLLPRSGAGVKLPAEPAIMHNLYHLLHKAADGAEWALTSDALSFEKQMTSRLIN